MLVLITLVCKGLSDAITLCQVLLYSLQILLEEKKYVEASVLISILLGNFKGKRKTNRRFRVFVCDGKWLGNKIALLKFVVV